MWNDTVYCFQIQGDEPSTTENELVSEEFQFALLEKSFQEVSF